MLRSVTAKVGVDAVRRDQRSHEAAEYRRFYKTARWLRIRKRQLSEHPLCERHLAKGQLVPATDVHHKVEHKGNMDIFWSGPFESLCHPCHSGPVQQTERIGFSTEIGADGWPTDQRHPANR